MKVIVVGGGEVGYHLAKLLSCEAKDIYVIDRNQECLSYIASNIDILPILGDAKCIETLKKCKIKQCDLLICVTASEDTNLLVSILSKEMGAKKTIARTNNAYVVDQNAYYKKLGVDTLISLVDLASKEIQKLLQWSVFTDDVEFDNGELMMFGIGLGKESPLIGKSVRETTYLNPDNAFKPLAVHRGEKSLFVKSDLVFQPQDTVYFISCPDYVETIISFCGRSSFVIKDIMILGGSDIGEETARCLENDYNVTIIERDKKRCEELTQKLNKSLVINLDARQVDELEEEGLGNMDAFIAVTGDSESNILASLMAKKNGVKKTIARVENTDYIHLSKNIGIDTLINKKLIAANNIFKYVRKGEVDVIANFNGIDAEVIEYDLCDENNRIIGKRISDLKLPKDINLAGVIRQQKGIIPFGDFRLEKGDKAIVFCSVESMPKVERYFL